MTRSIRPLLKLSPVHPAAPVTPYLWFLYQTRTIIQPLSQQPSKSSYQQTRQFAVAKKPNGEGKPRRSRAQFEVTGFLASNEARREHASTPIRSEKGAQNIVGQNDKDNPSPSHSNTFLEILQEHTSKPKNASLYRRSRAVTMTQKEHEVFERLQNMSGRKKVAQPESALAKGLDNNAKDEELAAIFNNVADKQEPVGIQNDTIASEQRILYSAGDEKELEKQSETIIGHGSLASATSQPVTHSGSLAPKHSQQPPSRSSGKVTGANKTNLGEELETLLSSAKSDDKLWKLLDKHIFQDMRDLAVVLKEKEGSRAHIATPAGKLMSKTGKIEGPQPKPQESQKNEATQEQDLLGKVTATYGPALLHSAQMFRTQFPRSPYAALLLPTIKKLGPISYVLAGSTALYNELLYIRWVYYRDLNGCADLIEDMVAHNILADERTSVVLQMASRARAKEMSAEQPGSSTAPKRKENDNLTKGQDISRGTSIAASGNPVKSFMAGWWQLQGIEAGWARWINAHERLTAMTHKEMQRQRDEQILANRATNPSVNGTALESSDISHSFAERQISAPDVLEPEIELVPLEDLDEPEAAAAA